MIEGQSRANRSRSIRRRPTAREMSKRIEPDERSEKAVHEPEDPRSPRDRHRTETAMQKLLENLWNKKASRFFLFKIRKTVVVDLLFCR